MINNASVNDLALLALMRRVVPSIFPADAPEDYRPDPEDIPQDQWAKVIAALELEQRALGFESIHCRRCNTIANFAVAQHAFYRTRVCKGCNYIQVGSTTHQIGHAR